MMRGRVVDSIMVYNLIRVRWTKSIFVKKGRVATRKDYLTKTKFFLWSLAGLSLDTVEETWFETYSTVATVRGL